MTLELIFDIVLIVIIVYAFVLCAIALKGFIKEGFLRPRAFKFALPWGLLFVFYLLYSLVLHRIGPSDWAQIFLVLGLVVVTGFYALVAFRQANASMKIADETKEQRIISSRPVIIQKAVYEKDVYAGSTSDYYSHFETYNAGKSPAIELEIFVTDGVENPFFKTRAPFFLTADEAQKFYYPDMTNLGKSTKYKLICQYQSIFSRDPQKTIYQTLLPFELVESGKEREGKIFVKTGELEFREVPWGKRILL